MSPYSFAILKIVYTRVMHNNMFKLTSNLSIIHIVPGYTYFQDNFVHNI